MITSLWTAPGGDCETALQIRKESFGTGRDERDAYGWHLILLKEGTPVAAGRIRYVSMGRGSLDWICVSPRWRSQGIGDGLVKILDYKANTLGLRTVETVVPEAYLHFADRLGFHRIGESEGGVRMEKETNDGTEDNCTHQCACKKAEG